MKSSPFFQFFSSIPLSSPGTSCSRMPSSGIMAIRSVHLEPFPFVALSWQCTSERKPEQRQRTRGRWLTMNRNQVKFFPRKVGGNNFSLDLSEKAKSDGRLSDINFPINWLDELFQLPSRDVCSCSGYPRPTECLVSHNQQAENCLGVLLTSLITCK